MDLVDCDDVTDTAILKELDGRFHKQVIYSSIGPILLALNPYASLDGLYSSAKLQQYVAGNLQATRSSYDQEKLLMNKSSMAPHVWMVPYAAFQQLRFDQLPQALVISGESGAGKTETTKKCLQLLSSLSAATHPQSQTSSSSREPSSSSGSSHTNIEDRILATNPVLESFGNSKTARNNNSSRFGKWIQVNYTLASSEQEQVYPKLFGAQITQYLLEKSRVVIHAADERNYHIFYQLCASGELDMQPAASYRYLRYSKNMKIPGVDDKAEFQLTKESMKALGFSETDLQTIFSTLKAILLLGNIVFHEDTTNNTENSHNGAGIHPDYEPLVHNIATILGVQVDMLTHCLISRSMTVRGETTHIKLNPLQAQDTTNALAKELYGRIFTYIVFQANRSLQSSPTDSSASSSNADLDTSSNISSIGLLDIFGFEKFKFNTFEQLCINYANEKLQQYFIQFVLKKEQELYAQEGIEFSSIIPIDNSDVLYLFENKKTGFFSRLDDEMKLPKGSDESFLKKVEQDHNNTKDNQRRFWKDIKMPAGQFEIRHFAGLIRYDCHGFMEKNHDKLFDDMEELLRSAQHPKLNEILTATYLMSSSNNEESSAVGASNTSNIMTIAARFQSQLNQLMATLQESQPHFIKCIKPNNLKQEKVLEADVVLLQLRYSGVLEALQIRKSGYPIRKTHDVFWRSYWMLTTKASLKNDYHRHGDYTKCCLLVESFGGLYGDIKVGKTMVFLRPASIQQLEAIKLERKLRAVVFTQSVYRKKTAQRLYAKKCEVRDALQKAMNYGKRQNSCNIDAIVEIHNGIVLGQNLDLPTAILQQAEVLLQRLKQIKVCLERLDNFTDENSAMIYNQDIFAEFSALQELLDTSKALGIHSGHHKVDRVMKRLSVLRERAEAIQGLRQAMEMGDDILIREALARIQALKIQHKHNNFCEGDELQAERMLVFIEEDFKYFQQLISLLKDFQQKSQSMMQEKRKNTDNIQSMVTEFNSNIETKMQSWKAESQREVSSARVQAIVNLLQQLVEFHSLWLSASWDDCAQLLQSLMLSIQEHVNAVSSTTQSARDVDVMNAWIVLEEILSSENQLIEKDIIANYLLPQWIQALAIGQVKTVSPRSSGSHAYVDYEHINIVDLQQAIDVSRSFTWLADSIGPFVSLLEQTIELRVYFLDQVYEKILSSLESEEMHQRRQDSLTHWLHEMQEVVNSTTSVSSFDEVFFSEHATVDEDGRTNFLIRRDSKEKVIGPEFDRFLQALDWEYAMMYEEAANCILLKKLNAVLQVETIPVTTVHDVSAFDTSIIELVMKYVHEFIALVQAQSANIFLSDHSKENQQNSTGFPSISVTATTSRVGLLVELRQHFVSKDLNSIVSKWEAGYWDALLSPYEQESAEDIVAVTSLLDSMKGQAELLVLYAAELNYEQQLLQALKQSQFTFTQQPGSGNGFSLLEDDEVEEESDEDLPGGDVKPGIDLGILIVHITNRIHMLSMFGALKPEFAEFFPFVELLIQMRSSITNQDQSLDSRLELVEKLEEASQSLESNMLMQQVKDKVKNEIIEMKKYAKYEEIVNDLKAALLSKSPPKYLIPYDNEASNLLRAGSRRRTASTSAASSTPRSAPLRVKSLSFDLGLSSPLANITASNDIDDILKEDGFMVDEMNVTTVELEILANHAKEFYEEILAEEGDLPDDFTKYLKGVELVRLLRESVIHGDWLNAYKITREIHEAEILKQVPIIAQEMEINQEYLNTYAVIIACQNALAKGQPVGLIGQVDYKTAINLQIIDEAVDVCQTIGCHTKRSEALFNALLIIADLRRAQKVGDWTEIKNVLTRAYNENIGQNMTNICFAELNRAIIERDNYDNINLIKAAIMNEEMAMRESQLDIESISVKELTTAVAKVNNMPEDTRGAILRGLHSLGDTMLKARKAASQKQWFMLESLVSVLKETIETFQDELDGKDRNGLAKKAMSFRMSSMHRGTMLNLNKNKNNSSLFVGVEAMPGQSSARIVTWEEFADVTQSIKREVKAIEHHFAVIALEQQLSQVLTTDGIVTETATGSIDRNTIQIEALQEILDLATNLDLSTLSLPKNLKLLRKVGLLILDIRQAVINDQWENMSNLLEETLGGEMNTWPEYSRGEIQTVRREVENRWIITNLTNAITIGKLVMGEFGDPQLAKVSYSHLFGFINTAKSLTPRTPNAFSLLYAAEKMVVLREMLVTKLKQQQDAVSTEVDPSTATTEAKPLTTWSSIKKFAAEVLDQANQQKLHSMILPEVRLIIDTAEDRIISDALEQALRSGGPTGEPGAISISKINTRELDRAYQQAIRSSSSKTEHVKLLLFLCRNIQKLREALQRAESVFQHTTNLSQQLSHNSTPRDLSLEAWKTIRNLLAEIFEAQHQYQQETEKKSIYRQNSMNSNVWDLCEEEINLTSKHAHIVDLRNSLIDTAIKASHVYAERNQISISDNEELQTQHREVLRKLCQDVDSMIEHANQYSFKSEFLHEYLTCASTLREFRLTIIEEKWSHLEDLVNNSMMVVNMRVLPEVEKEMAWVLCELHNNSVIYILRDALHPSKNLVNAQETKDADAAPVLPVEGEEEVWDLSNMHNMSFAERNQTLALALEKARKYRVTSKAASQWLECCENMYRLRHSLEMSDAKKHFESFGNVHNSQVTQTLRWFKDHAHICPYYVKLEAQRAYVMYQNDLLKHGLTRALQTGKPVGKCGQIDHDSIDTGDIETLLQQAQEIQPRMQEVEDLIESATIAFEIRSALKEKNMYKLRDIVDLLAYEDAVISLHIVDEVSVARAELDNQIVVKALTEALRSFEDTEKKALDFTFLNPSSQSNKKDVDLNLLPDSIDKEESPSGKSKQQGLSILESFSERRYSFANKNSSNIDPDTIDINILDYGLRMAKDHGVFSDHAQRLFRTVTLIKSLRVAMKKSEWVTLEEILSQTQFEQHLADGTYDPQASKEILAARSQLEIRAAIVDLSKALKVGWAKCSHGIVDTSSMNNALLADAIERADHCIIELSNQAEASRKRSESILSSPNQSNPNRVKKRVKFHDDKSQQIEQAMESTVEQQVKLLMNSAKLVLRIREILAMGDIEQAGQLAEDGLINQSLHYTVLDELKLYAKEINAALSSMRIIEELKEGMRESKIALLEQALRKALLHHDIHIGNDLGLICILTQAERQYVTLTSLRKQLLTILEQEFDIVKLKDLIALADRHKYRDEELSWVKFRLARLEHFQTGLSYIYDFLWRSNLSTNRHQICHAIINFAAKLHLLAHPVVSQAKVMLRMNTDVFRSVTFGYSIMRYQKFADVRSLVMKKNPTNLNTSEQNQADENDAGNEEVNEEVEQQLQQCPFASILPLFERFSPYQDVHYNILTETILLKQQYLDLPSSVQKYSLEHFPKLRKAEDFASRMNVISESLKKQMLHYSEQPLPTSLSKLPPNWAAVATFIFTNNIRGLERSLFTYNELLLLQLIQLGQQHVMLRDEILIQLIKQLRNNPDPNSCKRLWKMLCCCLFHFPPSKTFESYLELYLLQSSRVVATIIKPPSPKPLPKSTIVPQAAPPPPEIPIISYALYAQCAIRCLHQTIFRFGYDQVIKDNSSIANDMRGVDNKLVNTPPLIKTKQAAEELKPWFTDDFYLLYQTDIQNHSRILAASMMQDTMSLMSKKKPPGKQDSKADLEMNLDPNWTFIEIDLSKDPAFSPAAAAAAPLSSTIAATPSHPAAAGLKLFPSASLSVPTPGNSSFTILRATREDWITRFRQFNYSCGLKEGGYMTKAKFCSAIASTLANSRVNNNQQNNSSISLDEQDVIPVSEDGDSDDDLFDDRIDEREEEPEMKAVNGRFSKLRGSFSFGNSDSLQDLLKAKPRSATPTTGNANESQFNLHNTMDTKSEMDSLDRDVLYCILIGKRIANRASLIREFRADHDVFHFTNDEETFHSKARREWLLAHMNINDFTSELFFSQLQTSDLNNYAERFWDNVIVPMSKDCQYFPQTTAGRTSSGTTPSHANSKTTASTAPVAQTAAQMKLSLFPTLAPTAAIELSIGWELFREVVLTGMQKYLERFLPTVANNPSSSLSEEEHR